MNKEQLKQDIEEMKSKLNSIEQQLKDNTEYPIFKRRRSSGVVFKFTGLKETTAVMDSSSNFKIGDLLIDSVPHTSDIWEDVAYDKERDLFDGQPVECWEDGDSHSRKIRFYDAINTCAFTYDGVRGGYPFKNYEAVKPEHYTEWMLEAFKTLKR